MASQHQTVLLEPAVNALLSPGYGKHASGTLPDLQGVYVDGTFGRGGHSRHILQQLGAQARLLVFDKDPAAIAVAHQLQLADARVTVIHDDYAALGRQLDLLGIDLVDGILLDLGVSSPQIDEAARGFSFMRDGPLDMRMDTSRGETAARWLAQADQQQIKEVIANYGEERFALRIAKAIIARRESSPLRTTGELAQLVASVIPTREKGQHPATRTFQAIRVHINDELAQLARTLPLALSRLKPGGRLVIISFHSLEDRMVKQFFATAASPGQALARLPISEKDMPQPYALLLARQKADASEVAGNVRARSAVMRVLERSERSLSLAEAEQLLPQQARAPGRPRVPHTGSKRRRPI